MLAGDVNLPDMDWENGYVNPSPIHGHEVNQVMLDIANDYGLCHYSNINITIVAQLSTEDVNMLIFKRSIATNSTGGMYFRPSWCSCPSNFSCPCFGQFNVALAGAGMHHLVFSEPIRPSTPQVSAMGSFPDSI